MNKLVLEHIYVYQVSKHMLTVCFQIHVKQVLLKTCVYQVFLENVSEYVHLVFLKIFGQHMGKHVFINPYLQHTGNAGFYDMAKGHNRC